MASWESLPSEIQARVARTVSPRNMRSVGRVSRSGRGAANRVHAERVASAQRFREDPRMSAVLTGRSLKTRVLAAVLTAAEVGWTATLTRLRRAGFAVGPWHGAPMGLAGYEATKTFAMPGGVSVTTQILRMAAHGHDYERDGVYVTVQFPNYFIEFSIEPNDTVRCFHSEGLSRALLSDVALIASVKAGLARRGIDMVV
jgi:hypothetical protein